MPIAHESTSHLAALLRNERVAMADFIVALARFDAKELWRELGHASLFSFLRRELGLSAGAAQYRKTAAELVRRFPEVETALRAGRLCLSSVIELSKVLTLENTAEVLPRFSSRAGKRRPSRWRSGRSRTTSARGHHARPLLSPRSASATQTGAVVVAA